MARLILITLVALALTAGLSCYTMVRHPSTDVDAHVASDQPCEDCHSQAEASAWGPDPYFGYHGDYYAGSFAGQYVSPWEYYYAHPWWRHEPGDWQGHDGGLGPGGGGASNDNTSGRPAWDRGPGAPPVPAPSGNFGGGSLGGSYVPNPSPGGSGSVAKPDSTRRGGRSRDSVNPPSTTPPDSRDNNSNNNNRGNNNRDNNSREQKSDKEKEHRPAWGR